MNNNQHNKNKGDKYEKYIADYYRNKKYLVEEHGKEKGVKDGGIDLIAKKNNEVIFIQCKDWNENNSHKIDHKDIKVLRTDTNDFLEKNPEYKKYKIKMRYTLSGDFIHASAKKHINECSDDIDYEIIKPDYRENEQKQYTKKAFNKKKSKQGKEVEKIIIGTIVFIIIYTLITPTSKTKQTEPSTSSNKNIIVINEKQKIIKRKEPIKNNKHEKKQKVFKREERKKIVEKKIDNKQICNKKYWKLHKESTKKWWNIYHQNTDMKKSLKKRKLNYSVILKQRIKKTIVDIEKIKKESCSKEYFNLAHKEKIKLDQIAQENNILKELMKTNYIQIEKKEEPYYKNNKKEEREKAKNNLLRQMQ